MIPVQAGDKKGKEQPQEIYQMARDLLSLLGLSIFSNLKPFS